MAWTWTSFVEMDDELDCLELRPGCGERDDEIAVSR